MIARRIAIAAALTSAALLVGCSGLKFRNEAVNDDLPNDWTHRTFMLNSADLRFHMKENLGLLVTEGQAPGTYQVFGKPVLPDAFDAREEIIKDGEVYSSKITSQASIKGGYLTFAASLSASQAVDYRILDVGRVDVSWTQLPDAKIRAAASVANPKNVKRLWIQSLILSKVVSQTYSELSCDATGSGPAFKTDGKCFNSTTADKHDYAVAAVLVDIDKYIQDNPGPAPAGAAHSTVSMLRSSPEDTSASGPNSGVKPKLQKPAFIYVQQRPMDISGLVRK